MQPKISRLLAVRSGSSASTMSRASNTMRRALISSACADRPANRRRGRSLPIARDPDSAGRRRTAAFFSAAPGDASRNVGIGLDALRSSPEGDEYPRFLVVRAPLTRNCSENMVLPDPGPPCTASFGPSGRPPPLISSKPAIPVGAFLDTNAAGERSSFIVFPFPGMREGAESCPTRENMRRFPCHARLAPMAASRVCGSRH